MDYDFLDFHVPYHNISYAKVRRFKALLNANPTERLIQEFLEKNPEVVAAHLGAHAVYVVPKPRFGTHYEADFGIAECNSAGTFWTLVELERPSIKPFRKDGRPTAKLTHAIEQVKEWRRFIRANRDYCQRSRRKGGLGLEDISNRSWGVIVMGRRPDYSHEPFEWRKELEEEHLIKIMSYDRFLEWPTTLAGRNRKATKQRLVMHGNQAYLDISDFLNSIVSHSKRRQ